VKPGVRLSVRRVYRIWWMSIGLVWDDGDAKLPAMLVDPRPSRRR
jgi:hypothetical protein